MQEVNNFNEIENYAQALERAIQATNRKFLRAETPFYNVHWCRDEKLNRLAAALDQPFPPTLPEERRKMQHVWAKRYGWVTFERLLGTARDDEAPASRADLA